MEHLETMIEFVNKELADISQNGKFRNKDDVELVYKLIDIAKDVYCIWGYEDKMGDDYSENGRMMYPMNGSYTRPMGGNRYPNTQSYGRRGSYQGRYSRNDAKKEFIDNLYAARDLAMDEVTHQRIQRMIDEVEQY